MHKHFNIQSLEQEARKVSCTARTSQSHSDQDDFLIVASHKHHRLVTKDGLKLTSNVRVIEYKIVLVTDLMKELNTEQILSSDCYFGRFGKVEKAIISSKHGSYLLKNENIQAYITYGNEKDAALAIASLRNLIHHQRFAIKIHYGTSRYCSKFLEGVECPIKGCYFNHSIKSDHEYKDSLKTTLNKQYERAYNTINNNLEYFIEKQYVEFKMSKNNKSRAVNCLCLDSKKEVRFPQIKEVMRKLYIDGFVDAQKYKAIKFDFKNRIIAGKSISKSLASSKTQPKSLKKEEKNHMVQSSPCLQTQHQHEFKVYPAQSLQEYIQKNIIADENKPRANRKIERAQSKLVSFSKALEQNIKELNPFKTNNLGQLLGNQNCINMEMNPAETISTYIATKILKKNINSNAFIASRLPNASKMDVVQLKREQNKVNHILAEILVNSNLNINAA